MAAALVEKKKTREKHEKKTFYLLFLTSYLANYLSFFINTPTNAGQTA